MSQSEQPSPSPDLPPHHQVTVAEVLWARVLEFTYIFRGFRLAINPAKMVIALLAIVAIYSAGRIFDVAWGPQVYDGEIETYQTNKSEQFRMYRDQHLDARDSSIRIRLLSASEAIRAPHSALADSDFDYYGTHPRAAEARLIGLYEQRFQEDIAAAADARKRDEEREKQNGVIGHSPGYRTPAEMEAKARQDAADALMRRVGDTKAEIGSGIFAAFMNYELKQAEGISRNTLSFIRVAPARHDTDLATGGTSNENVVTGALISTEPERIWKSDTVAGCLANMTITAPCWLFSATAPMHYRDADTSWWGTCKTYGYRGLYLISLLMLSGFSLAVVAISGGTICRLSALEFAGQDKPSPSKVIRFVLRRFWNLVRAPLMPFAILLFLGVIIMLIGLVGAIPFVGEILAGMMFIVVLIVAFVAMLVLLGTIGGFNLLYPTIAVEGSDSFDAMSRGFAYVYARPWRLGFYSIVSLAYGVATYLFISFAVYLILAITHFFLGQGMGLSGLHQGWYSGLPKLDTLWPVPHVQQLAPNTNWWAMNWSEAIGAAALHFWLFLLISCIGAYVISYYHSANTIIYFLLRRSVDGQSLTEVYDGDAEEADAAAAAPRKPAAEPAPASPPLKPAMHRPKHPQPEG